MKTKTASVRLPKEMFEEIDNFCDDIGCTRNDWIKDTLKDKLRTQLDESTQDPEIKVEDIEPENKRIEARVKRVSYDGKTWYDVEPISELTNVTVEN
ncbi:MAG: hypothetical protein IIA83_06750 [Thaumarchaeota archaeon]|nr:hypothetical protein [Nitrososphaerota archaeon]